MADETTGAAQEMGWRPASEAPEWFPVRTRINDANGVRNDQVLVRRGRLWWFPDGTMYVYYTPTEFQEPDHA